VVRVDETSDLTAVFAATVASVDVRPGQHVTLGQPLVRFLAQEERGELDRLDKQMELALVRVMRDPSDQEARQSLTALRAQRDLARARVDERVVRAPRNGIVSDVRIRQGQHLAVGELILSVVGDGAPVSLIAVVPGRYRPSLRKGMPLRFELEGYRYQYQELVIDSISDAVIGPAEVRRYLGPEAADAMTLNGPLLLIRAHLPARTFVVDGQELAFFDGLPGHASVRVRSESILVSLLPALKGLTSHAR
jgi:membrane fusion protein (multidrug efflux system)